MSAEPKITEKAPALPVHMRVLSWYRRYPVALFLGGLGFSLIVAPFEEAFRDGELIESARLTVVVLTGLLALGSRRRTLVWGIVMVGPAIVGKWLNHWRPDLVPAWLFLAPALVFCVFVVWHLLRFILSAPRVDSEVLCAGVAGYLMLGILWALAYILVAGLATSAFVFTVSATSGQTMKGFTAFYYSFITLTTVGYGDIVPVSGVARMLAMMEAVTGTLYMAVMVARLVSLYYSPGSSGERAGGSNPDFVQTDLTNTK